MSEGEWPERMESTDDQQRAESDGMMDGSGEYWVRKSNKILGPYTATELRELTRQDHFDGFIEVSADPSIWQDPEPPAQSRSNATTAVMPIQLLDDEEVQDEQQSLQPVLPLVRVDETLLRTLVIAIYEDHIIVGRRYVLPIRIPEDYFSEASSSLLRQDLSRHRTVALSDVVSVEERCAAFSGNTTGARESKGRSIFIIRPQFGRRLRFRLKTAQTPLVRKVLRDALGERFAIKERKVPVLGTTLLVALCCLMLLLLMDSKFITLRVTSLIVLTFDLLMLLPFLGSKFQRRWKHWRTRELGYRREVITASNLDNLFRRVGTFIAARVKLNVLGLTTKVIAVLYMIAVLGPISARVSELFFDLRDVQSLVNYPLTLFSQLAWPILLIPGVALVYLGYLLSQKRYEGKSHVDGRIPILYLRPFEDDSSTSLQPKGRLASLLGISGIPPAFGEIRASLYGEIKATWLASILNPIRIVRLLFNAGADTSEENLVQFFEPFGPVVAIGNPADLLTSPGAQRKYIEGDGWKESVTLELKRAQAVILQPGLTEGVQWELREIRECVKPKKLLLSLSGYRDDPDRFDQVWMLLRETLGVRLPRSIPFSPRSIFVWFDEDWHPYCQRASYRCPSLWGLIGDAMDLHYTLTPFLQGMYGGEREGPRQPRWSRTWSFNHIAAVLAGIIMAVLVTAGPLVALKSLAGYYFPPRLQSIKPEMLLEDGPNGLSWKTHKGRRIAYRIDIPTKVRARRQQHESVEYQWASDDGRIQVFVVVDRAEVGLSGLRESRERLNEERGFKDIKVESSGPVEATSGTWIESRLLMQTPDGRSVREICRGRIVGDLVFLCIAVAEFSDDDHTYEVIASRILESIVCP